MVWSDLDGLIHWLTWSLSGLTGLEWSRWSDTLANLVSELCKLSEMV